MSAQTLGPTTDPIRLPRRTRPPLVSFAIPVLSIAAGVMLFMAVLNLTGGADLWAYLKAAVLAFSATMVAYTVNTLAIERGAPLAARGYLGAMAASLGSILCVGAGLFAATYSGLVLKDTTELRLQAHGTALAAFVGERTAAAAQSGRIVPAVAATAADLRQKLGCEIASSCVSGRGGGGHGPVARAIEEHAGRAASIADQVALGAAASQEILARLEAGLADYRALAGRADLDFDERQSRLATLDARIRQTASELDEALPTALVAAYADELRAGARIPGRAEAEARLAGILARHGDNLAAVIGGIGSSTTVPPAFPARAGVADTFEYIGHFLPVAAIAAVTELILPLVLWLYSYWNLHWTAFAQEIARREAGARREAAAADVVAAPAPVAAEIPLADASGDDLESDEDPPVAATRRASRRRNGYAGDHPTPNR